MSEERDDGGQAFPRKYFEWDYDENCRIEMSEPGMTLRDYLAAKAPKSLMEDTVSTVTEAAAMLGIPLEDYMKNRVGNFLKLDAKLRYMHADAMLEARDQ